MSVSHNPRNLGSLGMGCAWRLCPGKHQSHKSTITRDSREGAVRGAGRVTQVLRGQGGDAGGGLSSLREVAFEWGLERQ